MLEELKKAVEKLEIYKEQKLSITGKIEVDRDIWKLLETCHLLLNSPSLVEDKVCEYKSLTCREEQSCGCVNETWNACNEVNRIARVKWLQEKFENLPDIIFDCLDCDCVDAQLQNGDVAEAAEYIAKAIRQHFESGGL